MTTTLLEPERDRARIDLRHLWNLADLYPSKVAWRAGKDRVAAAVPSLAGYRGRLLSSASVLADALDAVHAVRQDFVKLYVYASMLADEDTRNSEHQGMKQEMTQLGATLAAESAYVEPEILRGDRATLDSFMAAEPRLAIYAQVLDDIT